MTTHLVLINSADVIQEDHLALRRRIRHLRQTLHEDADPAALWRELRALELALAEHFRHEDAEGYFDAILDSVPQFAELIAALKREHERFLKDVGTMKDNCRVGAFDREQLADLRSLYQSFMAEFDRHEHAEFRLIQETTNRDLGAAD